MIACISVDFGFLFIVLAPLGLCYINSMFDVVRIICDKVTLSPGFIVRNILSLIICLFYIISVGRLNSEMFAMSIVPLLTSIIGLSVAFLKEKDVIQN